jgi:hypothetical protein
MKKYGIVLELSYVLSTIRDFVSVLSRDYMSFEGFSFCLHSINVLPPEK